MSEQTAEFSPLDAARAGFLQDKFVAGWRMKGERLVHPTDPDLWLLVDPDSGELTLSGKLERQLAWAKSAAWMAELTRKSGGRISGR